MDFEKKAPEWKATGTEPPESLKESGFQAGYKPPAAIFNWFWNCVSSCLKELQEKVKMIRAVEDGGTGRSTVTSGSYLVGNGTGALNEKTPEQVREHIGAAKKNEAIPVVPAASADGIAYTATVEGVTELYNGMLLTIIPDVVSASNTITLNINDLGAKMVRLPLSFNNAAMTTPRLATYFTAGRPITLQYDAEYLAGDGIWKTFGKQRASAQDLYGTVPIEGGGTDATTAEEAREKLGITPENIGAVSKYDASGLIGLNVEGVFSETDNTTVRLQLRANKETGVITGRVDSKAGTKYPTFYTSENRPTPAILGAEAVEAAKSSSATRDSTNTASGAIYYRRWKNVVVVDVTNVKMASGASSLNTSYAIATGLPKCFATVNSPCIAGTKAYLNMATNGTTLNINSGGESVASKAIYGQLVYFTND